MCSPSTVPADLCLRVNDNHTEEPFTHIILGWSLTKYGITALHSIQSHLSITHPRPTFASSFPRAAAQLLCCSPTEGWGSPETKPAPEFVWCKELELFRSFTPNCREIKHGRMEMTCL